MIQKQLTIYSFMVWVLDDILLAENIDLHKFINLNQVVTETASALIGSIAIVISVPFTAIAASQMIKHFAQKEQDVNLNCNS